MSRTQPSNEEKYADTDVLAEELEGVSLVLPDEIEHLSFLTNISVTSTGISINDTSFVSGNVFASHNLNLIGFDKPQLVQLAHQFLLMNIPDCHVFEKELLSYIHVVSLNYRENRFHNFFHAVTVLHCVIVLSMDIDSSMLTSMDRLGLYLSALVHDVNHPGHQNNFEKLIKSPLSLRYKNESVLEKHHIAVSFTLMNSTNTDFTRALAPAAGIALKK
jgi:hypothetical protein